MSQSHQIFRQRLSNWLTCFKNHWWPITFRISALNNFSKEPMWSKVSSNPSEMVNNEYEDLDATFSNSVEPHRLGYGKWPAWWGRGTMDSLEFVSKSTSSSKPYNANASSKPTARAKWITWSAIKLVVVWVGSNKIGGFCSTNTFNKVFAD